MYVYVLDPHSLVIKSFILLLFLHIYELLCDLSSFTDINTKMGLEVLFISNCLLHRLEQFDHVKLHSVADWKWNSF